MSIGMNVFRTELPGNPHTAVFTGETVSQLEDILSFYDEIPPEQEAVRKGYVSIKVGFIATDCANQAVHLYHKESAAVAIHDSLSANMHPDIATTFSYVFNKAIEDKKLSRAEAERKT